ncbi:hypothetical protein LTR06_011176 [Exophiala xenobiotica]|nr:hypothetical protein LTR06_011176 [Exophiala xenobiotica]
MAPALLDGFQPEVQPPEVASAKVAVQSTTLSKDPYVIQEVPLGTRRPLRVVCMGAGYSGLFMAMMFRKQMDDKNGDLVIYERNEDLGGTWLENRYPGCQCDIPAHNYAYTFEPNPKWPNYYATSEQIHAYMKTTAAKYDAEKYIKYRHSVVEARWAEEPGKWKLKVRNTSGDVIDDECDVFINAAGVLNNWKWPSIEGLHDFEGKLLHSAHWDAEYDFTDKQVGVIGVGSSGIQIVPKLASVARSLTTFVRSQTWISPAPGINEPTANDPDMDEKLNFSPTTLERFEKEPEYLLAHRRAVMDRRIDNFKRAMKDTDLQRQAQVIFTKSMTSRLGDSQKGKKLRDMLLPKFPVGCRRQTPGPGFLEALLQDNVDTRWDDVSKITKKGILTKSGDELEFDAIVCATGFDTSFQPSIPIVGRRGVDLAHKWRTDIPKAYWGITVPDFPNYFSFVGPNSPLANGSLILAIQMTGMYIYRCMEKLQTEGYKALEIRTDANDEYNEHVQQYLARTVWVGDCRSWYKRGTVDGPVVAIYAGTCFHFMEGLKNPRWEDYDFTHMPGAATRNRFAYLGNGFTVRETKGGSMGATQTLNFDDFWKLWVLPEIHS